MNHHTFQSAVVIAGLVGLAGTAHGQNALGDGHALDRNLQVGSGGRNTRVRDIDSAIRFNESVINGSAGRGKAFHGNVAYSASDSFSARLPSNDLYTFRRDSAQGALVGTSVRGSDALRYQFAASTGQAVPSALTGGLGVVPRSFSANPPIRSTASSSLRSTADYLAAQAVRPTLVGYRADDNGTMYTATASPLLGVTWYPLEQDPGIGADLSANAIKPGDTTAGPARKTAGLTGLESTAAGLPSPMDIAGSKRDRAKKTGATGNDLRVKSESYSKVMDGYRDSYMQRTGAEKPVDPLTADEPASPWSKDLDQLRDTLRYGERRDGDSRLPGTTTPDAKPDPGDRPAPKADGPLPIPGVRPDDLIAPPKKEGPKAEDFLSDQMIDILRQGGVRIDTLRPTQPTRDQAAYAGHMQAGQQAIADGRFFDAEDRFTRAMSAMPSDPMAAVGRVHAQLGAGLYLSAANNLRELLRDHPELAGAKYNASLVPGEDRSKKIAEQLRIEIADAGTRLSRDASLLLAYLGRLQNDTAMQDEGLAAWKERIPADDTSEAMLQELLRKVWADR